MNMLAKINDPRSQGGDHDGTAALRDAERQAISCATRLDFSDADACFKFLYDYGCEPLSVCRANDRDATSPSFLLGSVCRLSGKFKNEVHGNWSVWTRRDTSEAPIYKAYLCPCFDDFQTLCLRLAPLLDDDDVAAFKLVSQRWMAVRPDKFIVYFTTPDARDAWLERVYPELKDLPANPTPFTDYWSTDGLVTVATDPDEQPGQSWRSTLLRDLAEIICDDETSAGEAIYSKLSRSGIDCQNWKRLHG